MTPLWGCQHQLPLSSSSMSTTESLSPSLGLLHLSCRHLEEIYSKCLLDETSFRQGWLSKLSAISIMAHKPLLEPERHRGVGTLFTAAFEACVGRTKGSN